MQCREGESLNYPIRVERFYCICEQWYFSTRECLQLGPYQSREEAGAGLLLYLRHVNEGGIYSGEYKSASLDAAFQL